MPPDSSRTRVLVIDDDKKLCRLIASISRRWVTRSRWFTPGPAGVEKATSDSWNAVILDVMLPGMDGFEVLKQIRKTSDVPVLMLTARGDEADRIVGLEIGADDYLPKTFSTRELLARLRAVHAPRLTCFDPHRRRLGAGDCRRQIARRSEHTHGCLDDQPLVLTPVEFDLLASLARGRGRVKSREQLIDEIRDRNYDVFDRSIDVHISALRKKLGDDAKEPKFIKTLRAAGYMFINPDDPR
jgi:DNA-binding response OmpR family regulator